jgi:uncharacterized protein YbjQ (UPF0145 family)
MRQSVNAKEKQSASLGNGPRDFGRHATVLGGRTFGIEANEGLRRMRIIYDNDIEGVKVVPIGRIHAASGWHGRRSAVTQDFYKAKALENLVDVAEDCDADAIIEVDYGIDHADDGDLPGTASLQRVSVSGLAVKLMRA